MTQQWVRPLVPPEAYILVGGNAYEALRIVLSECWPGGWLCAQSGGTVTWLMGIGLYLHSLFSGRRCTCDWTHVHDIDLWQELDLLLSFTMLGFFVCVFWEWVVLGEHVAFSRQVSVSSFLVPLHAQLIARSCMHTLPPTLCSGSPYSLLLDCFLPVPANSTHPSRSSFTKLSLSWEKSLPESPSSFFLTSVSLSSPSSLGLFLLPSWAMNAFRTRPYSIHCCTLGTTLLYLN